MPGLVMNWVMLSANFITVKNLRDSRRYYSCWKLFYSTLKRNMSGINVGFEHTFRTVIGSSHNFVKSLHLCSVVIVYDYILVWLSLNTFLGDLWLVSMPFYYFGSSCNFWRTLGIDNMNRGITISKVVISISSWLGGSLVFYALTC